MLETRVARPGALQIVADVDGELAEPSTTDWSRLNSDAKHLESNRQWLRFASTFAQNKGAFAPHIEA